MIGRGSFQVFDDPPKETLFYDIVVVEVVRCNVATKGGLDQKMIQVLELTFSNRGVIR